MDAREMALVVLEITELRARLSGLPLPTPCLGWVDSEWVYLTQTILDLEQSLAQLDEAQ